MAKRIRTTVTVREDDPVPRRRTSKKKKESGAVALVVSPHLLPRQGTNGVEACPGTVLNRKLNRRSAFRAACKNRLGSRPTLHDVGRLGSDRIASAEFRGYANQKAHDTDLKQISLREVDGKEQLLCNVQVRQRPTQQAYPAKIVSNSSNQPQSSRVVHGGTS
jgi:hypothetical protein